MIVRRFNEKGISAFDRYLEDLRMDSTAIYPKDLLSSDGFTEAIKPDIHIEDRQFQTRYELAEYIHDLFMDFELSDLENDVGLWAWLAFFYFKQVCLSTRSKGFPGARARYIPDTGNYLRNYRHMITGPYYVYRCHRSNPEIVKVLLFNSLSTQGDFYEQIASRQELTTNSAFLKVAANLYFDSSNGKFKRGAGGKGPGSPRRLAEIYNQFDLTYDLYGMTTEEITSLLPNEFDGFR